MADKRMTVEKFLALYMQAADDGVTRSEFAKKVGLKPATVYARACELRAKGVNIPLLKSDGRMSMIDRANAFMEKRGTKPSVAKVTVAEATPEDDPLADILGVR